MSSRASEGDKRRDRDGRRDHDNDRSRLNRKRSPESAQLEESEEHHKHKRNESTRHHHNDYRKQEGRHRSDDSKHHHRKRSHSSEKGSRNRSRSKERRRSRERHSDKGRFNVARKYPAVEKYHSQQGYKQNSSRHFQQSHSSTETSGSGSLANDEPLDINGIPNIESQLKLSVAEVGAAKLVEVEKRKLIFSKKENPAETSSTSSVWNQTKFTQDSDGKMTAKFKRLMGMKDEGEAKKPAASDERPKTSVKGEEYFAELEKQYEVARATTHTQRGVGLGFSTKYF